eukprot:gb/GEZN01004379.1/.p1 GENE.gb/GEZN01004379.1/~~gb/GEZN01004379.1/.p1  ORF type:complete len:499 (+),score=34.10 gb/GEZN01004379.1/:161-1657(+)
MDKEPKVHIASEPIASHNPGTQSPQNPSSQPTYESPNNEAPLASELTNASRSAPSSPSPQKESTSSCVEAAARTEKLCLDLGHLHLGGESRSDEQILELQFQLQDLDSQRVRQQSLVQELGDEQAHSMAIGLAEKSISEPRRKIFVGGIPWLTTDEELRVYFAKYGTVVDATIVRDSQTGVSRGYGFVTFKEPEAAFAAAQPQHILNGRKMDCKIAAPTVSRRGGEHVRKMFVGGLSRQTTSRILSDHFQSYGQLLNAVVMVDRTSGRSRGFGFVTFADTQSIGKVLHEPQVIQDRVVECHKALSRQQIQKQNQKKNNFSSRVDGQRSDNSLHRDGKRKQTDVRQGLQQHRYQEGHNGAFGTVHQRDGQQPFDNLNPRGSGPGGPAVYYGNAVYSPSPNNISLLPDDERLSTATVRLFSHPHFQRDNPSHPSQIAYSSAYQPNMQSGIVMASNPESSNRPAIGSSYSSPHIGIQGVPIGNMHLPHQMSYGDMQHWNHG